KGSIPINLYKGYEKGENCMLNTTVDRMVKKSVLYSVALSQPFAIYADAHPELQNKLLLQQETLQYGEHGELVRFLQQKLSKIAYYEDHIDGEYGVFTEYALKKFQKDYDITITGEADPQTVYALVQAEKEKIMEKIKNLSGTISIDMKSDDVQIIQESLQYLGYYQGEVDGIFGPLTEQAVRTVEERHNIDLIDESALATVYENEQEEEEVVSDLHQDEDEMVEHETDEGETSSDPESDSEQEENAEQHSSEESQIASEKEENEEQSVPSEGFDQNDLIGEARAHIGT